MTPNEIVEILNEIAGSDPELHTLIQKAKPHFSIGDEGYDLLSLYIQGLYGENEGEERTEAIREFLTEFLESRPKGSIPPYIEGLEIQRSYWKPYLILFKCRYEGKRAFGKLFIMGDDDVDVKYRTELDINRRIIEPLLPHTQNIPRLLHVDEHIDAKAFYAAVKSELLEKH